MSKAMIHVLHGPNLNLLGQREPEIYGSETLKEINDKLSEMADSLGFSLLAKQSNVEGELVTFIQEARGAASALMINPGGYSHTSVAIRDALSAFEGPIVEVHLSNIHAREEFRKVSLVSEVVDGVICGLGSMGYELGLQYLARKTLNKS